MSPATPPDLVSAAEGLRSWLDELAREPMLEPWRRTHAAPLIAAALALEELAAGTQVPAAEVGP